jgi:hypothetical protein
MSVALWEKQDIFTWKERIALDQSMTGQKICKISRPKT